VSLSSASRDCRLVTPLRRLDSIGQIDSVVDESRKGPVLIFKHSVTCGLSAQAYDEVLNSLHDLNQLAAYVVCVQTERAVSSAVAQRFAIRHESPQLLVLVGGHVHWTASHFRVNESAIRRALSQWIRPEL
jgi:bacillithiol system protein YtxJ